MVAANGYRCREFPFADQVVHSFAHAGPFAVAQPADTCRESLKGKAAACEPQPPGKDFVLGKELESKSVCAVDIFGIARERYPAKWSGARAEERANVLRHEAGDEEGLGASGIAGEAADIVAVIEGHGTGTLQCEHGVD